MKTLGKLALVAAPSLLACASARPIPKELTDARAAFAHATGSEGAPLVQAQLHVAQLDLEKAEKAFVDEPEAPMTVDLAYLAERSAQRAEAQGIASNAEKVVADSQKALADAHAGLASQRQEELDATKKQLEAIKMQEREAITKILTLKNAVKEDSRGLVITMASNVLFKTGKADLLPAARSQLDELAKALAGTKQQTITVEGYTDEAGGAKRNEELSLHRAEAVKNYLVQKGLPGDNVKAVGQGPSKPVADNKTVEGRASNRRVEIVVQAEGT